MMRGSVPLIIPPYFVRRKPSLTVGLLPYLFWLRRMTLGSMVGAWRAPSSALK